LSCREPLARDARDRAFCQRGRRCCGAVALVRRPADRL